jgi:rubredoxin
MKQQEETIVRQNLMDDPNYRPYCGNMDNCYNPRTQYRPIDGQFICPNCKWISQFPADFVARYRAKHNINKPYEH